MNYKINKIFRECRVDSYFKLVSYTRRVRCCSTLEFINMKGSEIMKNRNIFTGIACVGLFANLFVSLAGENLTPHMADIISNTGNVAIASALLFFILSQKSESEEQNERDNFYRDFDSVYRYIDDTSRDLRDEIRTCSSNSEKCCSKKSVR